MAVPAHMKHLGHLFQQQQYPGIGKPPNDSSRPFADVFYAIADLNGVHHMTHEDYDGKRTPEAVAAYFQHP